MREQDVFVLADRALNAVVAAIGEDQWAMPMPAEYSLRDPDVVLTLREVINLHAYDDAWVPDMLAGHTMAEVGEDHFDGDLLGAEPAAAFAAIVEAACAAAVACDELDRTVHTSFGDFPAREYLWQINFYRGLRAHDIAVLTGVDVRLPDALVEGLWEELAPIAATWREIGVFGPEVSVPETARLHDRLLGLTGRQPD